MLGVVSGFAEWAPIIIPTLTVIVGTIGVYAGGHSFMRERHDRERRLEEQAERLENAADLVLGRNEDPRRGRPAIKGILPRLDSQDSRLDKLSRAVGINGHPLPDRSILQMLKDAEGEMSDLRHSVDQLTSTVSGKGFR